MIGKVIGIALAALLLAGPSAFEAAAQSSGNQPAAPAAPAAPKAASGDQPAAPAAAKPAAPVKPKAAAAAKTPAKPKTAAAPKAPAEPSAAAAALEYPPCSKTVRDRCIQLWQADLGKAYPQCIKLKGPAERAACIEDAFKQAKK